MIGPDKKDWISISQFFIIVVDVAKRGVVIIPRSCAVYIFIFSPPPMRRQSGMKKGLVFALTTVPCKSRVKTEISIPDGKTHTHNLLGARGRYPAGIELVDHLNLVSLFFLSFFLFFFFSLKTPFFLKKI